MGVKKQKKTKQQKQRGKPVVIIHVPTTTPPPPPAPPPPLPSHPPPLLCRRNRSCHWEPPKRAPYVSSAPAIRLHCGAGGRVHQEKISPPLRRLLSHWPVTRPAPFEGTPDIPADNLFHSSAQLSEDRPNHSTRPAL